MIILLLFDWRSCSKLQSYGRVPLGTASMSSKKNGWIDWYLFNCNYIRKGGYFGKSLEWSFKEEQELIDYIHADVDLPTRAARHGHLNVLMLLYKHMKNTFPLNEWLFSDACKSGSLEVLKWLHSKNCPYMTQMPTYPYWQWQRKKISNKKIITITLKSYWSGSKVLNALGIQKWFPMLRWRVYALFRCKFCWLWCPWDII